MTAYVDLQQKRVWCGVEGIYCHGTSRKSVPAILIGFLATVTSGQASTSALHESTEEEQFQAPGAIKTQDSSSAQTIN